MLGHRQLTLDEYMGIFRRRKKYVLILGVLGPLIGFGLSLVLPPKYTSSTLVLVEQQKVPENLIRPVLSDTLNQRLSTMQEQILSRSRLQPLIERFNLYRADREKASMEDLVARMRKNITVNPLKPSAGAGGNLTFPGFSIDFTSDDPRTAQQICAEITSMFMEENLKIREQRAQGTTDFLAKELEDAKRKLEDQDAKLAEFKHRYIGQLPGQEQGNMNVLMSLNAQLEAVTSLINRTQQDKSFAVSLLEREQAAWENSQVGASPQTLEQQLAALQNQLITLEGRYTPDHPDVIKLRNDIAQLKKKIEEAAKNALEKPVEKSQKPGLTEPGQLMGLRNQIRLYQQTLDEKTRELERLHEAIKTYQARVQMSPVVEQEYKDLNRDYGNAVAHYDDLLGKKTQSEMAVELERRQQGEQFRVMDPANLPEEPSFPNRIYFTLGGLAGGLGIGMGLMVFAEMRDKAIMNERDIELFLELPTLALLPTLDAPKRSRKFWKSRKKAAEESETAVQVEV